MTMSLVGKPTTAPVRATDDASAPGTDHSPAEDFAGIVAAIVAGDQAASTTATATSATTVPIAATSATLPSDASAIEGAPAGKKADESEVAPSADPAELALALALAGAGVPVIGPALASAATATVPSPAGQGAAAAPTTPVNGLSAGNPADASPRLDADAGNGSGSHTSPDGGGAAQTQPIIVPAPAAPAGDKAGSVAVTLSESVAKIAAAKTADSPALPTVAAAQVAPATVAMSSTATVAAPGTPAGTAAQLAPAVFAVHRRGVEGTHHMTVDITPDELGPVRLTVALRDGQMHVLLAGSSEVSREAMRAALPELRKLVEEAGIAAGSFDVHPDQPDTGRFGPGTSGSLSDPSSGGSGSSSDHLPPDPGQPDRSPATAPERPGPLSASRSLDLHL